MSIENDGWGESDQTPLKLSRRPTLEAKCRDRETREWFKAAKARSETRMGQSLTHEEFTQLLLDIFEFHENAATEGADDA